MLVHFVSYLRNLCLPQGLEDSSKVVVFKLRPYFWSSFRFTVKLRGRYTFSIYFLPPHMHGLHYQHPPLEWYICHN